MPPETAPKVSVLMPAYNAADTIAQAALSLREQTLADWECVIVDDGSTDGTAAALEALAAGDHRFAPMRLDGHRGLVAALNAGLARCRGAYVARMDADDRAGRRRLEAQAALLDQDPRLTLVSCLVHSFCDTGPVPEGMSANKQLCAFAPLRESLAVPEGMLAYEEWLNSVLTHEDIVRDLFVESPFAHPSVMYRRAAVDESGGYRDRGWPEDYDLWMRLWMAGARFAKCPELLLEWRDRPERMSRAHPAYSRLHFRKLKAHYLLLTYLRERREVTLWGADRGGRWWAAALLEAGVRVRRFVDVDPDKTSRRVGDIPIVAPEALARRVPGDFILGAVGERGARPHIRAQLLSYGYSELEDFLFLA